MEASEKFYDNTDREHGILFHDMDKAVRREMKKQEKPKTKPAEVFEGFKETKSTKKAQRRKNPLRFAKDKKIDYRK